jgi:hypothetical protein
VSTAPPPLAPDLTAGLRRLKLAAMRRLAPELLVTAKTQRWSPEELLRTLVEAEITARGRVQRPPRHARRGVPSRQDSRRVRPGQLLHPSPALPMTSSDA